MVVGGFLKIMIKQRFFSGPFCAEVSAVLFDPLTQKFAHSSGN